MKISKTQSRALLLGLVASLIYGLLLRILSVEVRNDYSFSIMSIGFLFFGPLAIGAISVSDGQQSKRLSFFWPWIPVLLGCLVTYLLNLEGLICIAMYLPMALILAGLGGLIGRYVRRRQKNKMMLGIVMLPLISAGIENHIPAPVKFHQINNEIAIHASPEKVWKEIKSVRTISNKELQDSWVHKIGFPRPLDAEINHEGVGGVRLARFQGNLVFNETVDVWEPESQLSFQIAVDPKAIPPTTLDEHVTIGGPYFDVLRGTYIIEKSGEEVVLKLQSRFRLSTHFNGYASLWTSLIMNRIQGDILSVIKARAEQM